LEYVIIDKESYASRTAAIDIANDGLSRSRMLK